MKTDDDFENLLTPDGNVASERCPICRRLNSPGACDHCQHFYGSFWDGEIIWSNGFENFEKAWNGLVDALCELDQNKWSLEKVQQLTATSPEQIELLARGWLEESGSPVLVDFIPFDSGPPVITGGMLSGEGYCLYLDDFSRVDSLIEEVRDMTQRVRRI